MRQIVLDTETTGLQVDQNHRIIEIGCIELINRRLTGNHYHTYINPQREVEAGAKAVHGITDEFLKDKPFFHDIANTFLNFIEGAELIIHNAPFDLGFIESELKRLPFKAAYELSQLAVIDTLQLARQKHVGQRNSLDGLCKRYNIDLSKRQYHGALLDAHLLAQVYLLMTGGQGSFFDMINEATLDIKAQQLIEIDSDELVFLPATADELQAHERYLSWMKEKGACLWLH